MDSKDQKETPADRLRMVMNGLNITSDYALSRLTGVKRSTIKNILDRKTIGPKSVQSLSRALHISPNWLEFGVGPMRLSDESAELPVGGAPGASGGVDPAAYAYVRKATSKLSAGGGVIPEEEFESQRYAFLRSWLRSVATSAENCILMEIDGDSMHPTLDSGDIVLIDMGRTEVISDGVFAFGEGDVINIKRIQRAHPKYRIISDNSDEKKYPCREVEPCDIRIIGRIIWLARMIK